MKRSIFEPSPVTWRDVGFFFTVTGIIIVLYGHFRYGIPLTWIDWVLFALFTFGAAPFYVWSEWQWSKFQSEQREAPIERTDIP